MSQTPTASSAVPGTRAVLEYDGKVSELFGIFLLNLLLTILTLGIFRFWAITRIRRYLWSHMRFEGTRFSYTGKGKEMFLGFLLAVLILLGFVAVVGGLAAVLAMIHPALMFIPLGAAYLGIFVLFGAAHFSAQRYRMSRTEWRGIRGGMEGSAIRYGFKWLLYLLLVAVTFAVAVPWMQVGLARLRINASRFGSAAFGCAGRARRLCLIWLATVIGCILMFAAIAGVVVTMEWSVLYPVFAQQIKGHAAEIAMRSAAPIIVVGYLVFIVGAGLLATWYYTSLLRVIVDHTSAVVPGPAGAETLHFSTTVTAGSLLWLVVSNVMIALVTLGFGLPIVLHRYARYLARTTLMSGSFEPAALAQSTFARPALGEGFLQALDPGIV